MQGPHLIGMVAEVGGRAGIVEREHAANEERTLVMAHAEGTAESSAGLTVGHVAVGEAHAAGGGESVGEFAGLAHKAIDDFHAARNLGTAAHHRVLADDARANVDGVFAGAVDGRLVDARSTANEAAVANHGIAYLVGTHNGDMVANGGAWWAVILDGFLDKLRETVHERLVVAVFHHERCQLAVEFAEKQQIAVAHLVEH